MPLVALFQMKRVKFYLYTDGVRDLPKGKAEKGETIRETAIREVMEETGIENLKIDKYFSNTFHIVRNKRKYFLKETSWFLMSSNFKGKLKPQIKEGINLKSGRLLKM